VLRIRLVARRARYVCYAAICSCWQKYFSVDGTKVAEIWQVLMMLISLCATACSLVILINESDFSQ